MSGQAMARKRSNLWLHFSEKEENKAKCDICKSVISYKGGSTANLRKHLNAKHPTIIVEGRMKLTPKPTSTSQLARESGSENEPMPLISTGPFNQDEIASTSTAAIESGQAKVQSTLKSFITHPISVVRQKRLDNLVLNMIIRDFQPFSIVSDAGFRDLIAGLDPSYKLPNRSTLSKQLLPQKYDSVVEVLKKILQNAEYICLTTDSWTSSTAESYIAVTGHFISEEWEMKSSLLECFPYSERHTAENLKNELFRVADNWGVRNKVHCVVSDNAANITAAVRLTSWTHLPCFAHTLNLVVQSAIRPLKTIQQKVKSIVEYFHRSTVASAKLKALQLQMNPDGQPLKLKNDVITRWNSTYYMFQRICEIQEALEAAIGVLHNPVQSLSLLEWKTLRELIKVLKPFEQATNEISAEKDVTISKVILLARGLGSTLSKMQHSLTSEISLGLINELLKSLSIRFHNVELHSTFSRATFLDPRFKKIGFNMMNDTTALNKVKEGIIQDALRIRIGPLDNSLNEIPTSTSSATRNPVENMEEDIWMDFDNRASFAKSASTPSSAAHIEVRQFSEEPNMDRKNDPLLWWKTRALTYPRLAKLARKNLGIVATSVPSERIFSKTWLIISERRSRLKSKNVQMIVFLNANKDLFN